MSFIKSRIRFIFEHQNSPSVQLDDHLFGHAIDLLNNVENMILAFLDGIIISGSHQNSYLRPHDKVVASKPSIVSFSHLVDLQMILSSTHVFALVTICSSSSRTINLFSIAAIGHHRSQYDLHLQHSISKIVPFYSMLDQIKHQFSMVVNLALPTIDC